MSTPSLVLRVAAAQATLDRFRDRPHRFGRNDCVRMVAFHLRRLGYQVRLPASGSYASARSGIRALKARGYDGLGMALDDLGLVQIAPAEVAVGDILLLPSDDRIGALTIALGNGRCVGYHQDAPGAVVLQPLEFEAAWAVEVRR